MTQHDEGARLRHMLDASREAVGFAKGKSRADLHADRGLQLILTRLLEIVGEAANKVPQTRTGNGERRIGERMTGWKEDIREKLSAPVFRRTDEAAVLDAFSRLGASFPDSFVEFFRRYVGPFGSRRTGFELLDVCEGKPTIITSTLECRNRFTWPEHLVVLTELLGNSVLVLDAIDGAVYNVDLEGGERLIVEGNLLPAWGTFQAFIQDYFQ